MTGVVEKRGREVAAAAFSHFGPNDARKISEAFLAVSSDGGWMYLMDVERSDHSIAFKVNLHPLKDPWIEADISDERLAMLCRAAGGFDRGQFDATGCGSPTSPGRRDTVMATATFG